jgi:hypothetical protein
MSTARNDDRLEAVREPPKSMPATLDALAQSLAIPPPTMQRLAAFGRGSRHPFPELVDPARELLGGVVPDWPLLAHWNRWCLAKGARFVVWRPERNDLPERSRMEALLHTIMMISAKEQAVHDYLASGVREAEVAMASDDCEICDEHRHRIVPLAGGAMDELPPFHPGCRCGVLPRLD